MKYTRLKNSLKLFVILLFYLCVFLYSVIFNNSAGWSLFFFLTFLLFYLFLSILSSLKKVQLSWTQNTIYTVGLPDEIELKMCSSQSVFFKIPLLTLFFVHEKQEFVLYAGKSTSVHFKWTPTKRGVFQQLPLMLTSTDPLRILTKQAKQTIVGPFVVMPILQFSLAEEIYQQLIVLNPVFASPFGFKHFSVHSLRKYQVGDSLKLIDWKQSGKKNELIVKEYDYETETDPHFIFYGLAHDKFEASLSIYYSFTQLAETKFTFQQTILGTVPDETPQEQLIAAVMPLENEASLPKLSKKKVVIFSPTESIHLNEQLNYLRKHNDIFLVTFKEDSLYLDWKGISFPLDAGGRYS